MLVLGSLLFPAYLLNYDLAVLALPLAWAGWQGWRQGWLPGEPCVLILAWASPLLLLPVETRIIPFPLTPLILIMFFGMLCWRAFRATETGPV